MRNGAVLLVVLAACAGELEAPAKHCNLQFTNVGNVRAFVFGHAQRMTDFATYGDFTRAWRRHAMEVKPCLSMGRPNLLVFPEDAGLGAMLMGGRGALARRLPDSTGAFLAAAGAYAPAIAFYGRKFPDASAARLITLAASDPVWRAMTGAFGGMAAELGVWVLTSANVADVEETRDGDAMLRVRDPGAPLRDPAYVARTQDVFNSVLLFAPDGSLAGRVNKVFLVPSEEGVLDLMVIRDVTQPMSVPLAAGTVAHQRNVDLASDGAAFVVAAWQEDVDGRPVVRVSTSDNGGARWSEPVTPEATWDKQVKPAVCVGPGRNVVVAWQQGEPGSERIHAWRSGTPGGIVVDNYAGPQWDADRGFVDTRAWIVWTDLRYGAPRVVAASWLPSAGAPAPGVDVDAPPDDAKRLDAAQAQPSISPTGGHVVWVDHRGGCWDVRYARVDGARFTESIRVDGADSLSERLHSDPVVVADTHQQVWVAFTDLHSRRGVSDVGWVLSTDGGRTFGPHRAVPGGADEQRAGRHGGSGLPRFRPALVVTAQGLAVFFQDLAPLRSVIMAAGPAELPIRLDDTGTAPLTLTRPRGAALAAGTLVAWEDNREGPDRVYVARLAPP